jgi:hypothetical protein
MNCQEVQPFVSALHDGQTVSMEAAEHIGDCSTCKERLREYAQMGAELRLLASAGLEETPASLPALPARARRWTHTLTARVLVPRFALGLGVILIAALSLSLGVTRAQVGGLWFQFEVTSPERNGSWGNEVQAGYRGKPAVISRVGPSGEPLEKLAAIINVDDVQHGLVRLSVRARRFEVAPPAGQGARPTHESVEVGPTFKEMEREMLATTTPHQYEYIPGQELEIPVEGGGKLLLTGRVLERYANFWVREDYPLEPKADQIVLNEPALVRDNQLLVKGVGSASAYGRDPYVAVFVPKEGLFGFLLKPIDGAVEAEAEYGRVRFKIGEHDYLLFAATPVTGGQQPRGIWVYYDPNYQPTRAGGIGSIESGSDFLKRIRNTEK